jgi:hypothetical protein
MKPLLSCQARAALNAMKAMLAHQTDAIVAVSPEERS